VLIGYARTSTLDQEAGFEAQQRDLRAVGCARIFCEQVSSAAERPQLDALLAFIREGDVVVVVALDRLCRSIRDLISIKEKIVAAGASLRILSLGLDTASATGDLILNVLGSVAEFERKRMLERQKEGIAAAKLAGKYVGRQPTALRRSDEVLALRDKGVRPFQIAKITGLGRTSVWRILSVSREVRISPPAVV
jgi:DNA invertase Pin-like site-specific DNA recombinase